MRDGNEIIRELKDILNVRIMLLDGAMGTQIQARDLTPADFGGAEYEGCNENLVLTRPDVIRDIHKNYYLAGSDIVETNTFGSTPLVLAEYNLAHKAYEISKRAAELAREAARECATPGRPRFVAGSMGPTTKTITVTGGVTFEQLIDSYYEQARGLVDGGADILLMETCQDTRNIKAGIIAIKKYFDESGIVRPIMISGTIEPMGTMLAGQAVDALYTSLEHAGAFSFGLNCATGPEFMTDHIRTLAGLAPTFVSCYPNAGMPDEEGRYNESPDMMTATLERFADHGWVNILGGCCGTTPEYIKTFRQMIDSKKPRRPEGEKKIRAHVSGIEYLEFTEDARPVMVGETTNVLGSRKFKKLIADGQYEEGAEMGREQARGGAQVLDVCMQDPDRDEMSDMKNFLGVLIKIVKAPLMLDSTDHTVLAEALKYCQGKSIINSINLEDGEDRFEKVVPLIRQYGAAVVVGCIDEDPQQGMAVTVERKLAIAKRSHKLLTEKYGLPEQDLIFDALVFPVGTGDQNYRGSAKATVEGIRAIKQALPNCKTVLGVSNVSFGLPAAGREVMNSVFLYDTTKAGLDLAIVNAKRVMRYSEIPENERELCRNLLYRGTDDDLDKFSAFYKEVKRVEPTADELKNKTLEERLAHYIIVGTKSGLADDLNAALKKYPDPLEIINGPLMAGMAEVGRLFNNNELIVAEVLQSAEAMKAAVAHLEPHMTKASGAGKGRVILATVKGDVHDIGKNLVEIILSNNGYQVINLGIKVAPETLIEACRVHKPDIIGLSGLLVKSAQQMVITAQDFHDAGIDVPLMVGGAALSQNFTLKKISPAYARTAIYAKDAMNGLDLANQVMEPEKRRALLDRLQRQADAALAESAQAPAARPAGELPERSSEIDANATVMRPPDLKRHILDSYDLDEIQKYINPHMLFKKHLGFKTTPDKIKQTGSEREKEIVAAVEALMAEGASKLMKARGVYRFFPCLSEGSKIHIYDSPACKAVLQTFEFPRQPATPFLCLSDFVRRAGSEPDYVAMFVVSAGEGVRELAENFKNSGEYLKSHGLQALALETAEAFAELLHKKIRAMWGFADPADMTVKDLYAAKYRGIRVSFGYPACPNLDDQQKLFALLKPEEVGVQLTEGCMMEPEASVSALVFHHPQAKYFNAEGARG